MIKSWACGHGKPHTGRRVTSQLFENELIGKVVFMAIDGDKNFKAGTPIANILYSYENLKVAARTLQKSSSFRLNEDVQSLKFSNSWCTAFLRRQGFKRCKVTTVQKVRPTIEEIEKSLSELREAYVSNNLTDDDVINCDECGIWFGESPHYQFLSENDRKEGIRASVPESDDHARFTGIFASTGSGNLLPCFIILKNTISSKQTDQTTSTVLHNLSLDENWEHGEYVFPGDGKFRRNYLRNKITGAVISSQSRAWCDEVAMAMYLDLVLIPWRRKHSKSGNRCVLILDNAPHHSTARLNQMMTYRRFIPWFLPKNSSSKMQPMDLALNSIIKSRIRTRRAESIRDYAEQWYLDYSQAISRNEDPVQYKPPAPKRNDGVAFVLQTFIELEQSGILKEGLAKSFQRVGLCPDVNKQFAKYTGEFEHQKEMQVPDDGMVFESENVVAPIELFSREDFVEDDDTE